MTTHRTARGRRSPRTDSTVPRSAGRDRALPGDTGRDREGPRTTGRDRERGSATAELAVALPIVVLTLLLGVGALGAGMRMVALQDAVADAARILGRGDDTGGAGAAVARADPSAGFAVSRSDGLVCVTASAETRLVGGIAVPIRATGCALDGGR